MRVIRATLNGRTTDRLRPAIALVTFIYCALVVHNALTRTGQFTQDSLNYVNVAHNIVSGRGLTQPTVGFNQARFDLDDISPIPFTGQAPLYALLIALVGLTGVSLARAALCLSSISHGLVLWLVHTVVARAYGRTTALIAIAALVVFRPLRFIADHAWTEAIGLCFVLITLSLLASGVNVRRHLVLAGVAAGLAFATRYAFLAILPTGVAFIVLASSSWRSRARQVLTFLAAAAIPAGLVLAHNRATSGVWMPSYLHHDVTVWGQIKLVASAFADEPIVGMSTQLSLVSIGLAAAGTAAVLFSRYHRDTPAFLRSTLWSGSRSLAPLWTVGYLAFLMVARWRTFVDIDARTVAPAALGLIICASAIVPRARRGRRPYLEILVLAVLCFRVWGEVVVAKASATSNAFDVARRSERLAWIAANTSNDDLFIGADTVELPFFVGRDATVSFSSFPYSLYPTYERIVAYAETHCHRYSRIFLVLPRDELWAEQKYRDWYGDFFGDLLFGQTSTYPAIVNPTRLRDGVIYRIRCNPEPASRS